MTEKRLHVARDRQHVFLYVDRSSFSGRQAARITERVLNLLRACDGYTFVPAHDADVFAWVVEFVSPRSAARFFRHLLASHRARPL